MPMIQPFDGSLLINSYRAGRRDRIADDEASLKRRKGESELATDRVVLPIHFRAPRISWSPF